MSGDELPAHAAPFALELPEGTRDASTWCFVLPGERSFSPSVVIKRDDLPEDQSPLAYLVAQAAQLAEQLPGFELLAEPSQPEEGPPSCRVRWGGDPQSYVQTLRVQPLDLSCFVHTSLQVDASAPRARIMHACAHERSSLLPSL